MQRAGQQKTYTYSHNNIDYAIEVNIQEDSMDLKIDDARSGEGWKNSFSSKYVVEVTEKAGRPTSYTQFSHWLLSALQKKTENLFIDIMSSFDLQTIKMKRGGQPSQTNMKANKRYIILSVNDSGKHHFPLPLNFIQVEEKDRLRSMIMAVKEQLEQLKNKNAFDKSSSVISESGGENLRNQNEQLKLLIKQAQQQLGQKKGAVEMDLIIREKNDLEMKVDAVRREENKEILKLKAIFAMKERQVNDMKNQINIITRELEVGEEANPKLKNHLMRVTKVNENELNNNKKLVTKQQRQIQNIKRNIANVKNNEKKLQMKIKALQTEIEQAKKKANVKEISNRLHSPASKKSNISAPNQRGPVNMNRQGSTRTDGSSSIASKDSKPRSYNGPVRQNIVRTNIVNKPKVPMSKTHINPLARTTPAMNPSKPVQSSTLTRPYTRNALPVAPRNDTSSERRTSLEKKQNNFLPTRTQAPTTKPLSREPLNPTNKRSNSREVMKPTSQSRIPVYNARPKVQQSEKERNIFNKIESIKNRLETGKQTQAPQRPSGRNIDAYKKK